MFIYCTNQQCYILGGKKKPLKNPKKQSKDLDDVMYYIIILITKITIDMYWMFVNFNVYIIYYISLSRYQQNLWKLLQQAGFMRVINYTCSYT